MRKARRLLLFLIVLVLVIGVVLFAAGMVLRSYLSPERLVAELESRLNCRAEVASVSGNWWGSSRVVIRGIALGPRDDVVEMGAPLSERPPLESPVISVKSIDLKAQPFSLVKKRIDVSHFHIDGVVVELAMSPDGGTELDGLFRQPGDLPEAASEKERKDKAPRDEEDRPDPDRLEKRFPFALLAERAEVSDSRISLRVEKTGTLIELKDARFVLQGIDVNPAALADHNRAGFEYAGRIEVGGEEGEDASGGIFTAGIAGTGEVRPLDPERGWWDPSWRSEITFAEGSRFDTVPLVEQIKEKLAAIERPELDLGRIAVDGTLKADASTALSYGRGRYEFEEELALDFGDTGLTVHSGSWLNAARGKHRAKGTVSASEDVTAELVERAEEKIAGITGGLAPEGIAASLLQPVTEDGRLQLDLVSQGDLGEPKVSIAAPIDKLKDVLGGSEGGFEDLKQLGRGLLEGMLKGK